MTGSVDVVVVGAGHSGLAMSRYLAAQSIEHVILERGEVANSWVCERWDSLKLLTPNWQNGLPGQSYSGRDPDGYMSMPEVIGFIKGYAADSGAPVLTETEVTSVRRRGRGYHVVSNRGELRTRALVVASGAFNVPAIPRVGRNLPRSLAQLSTHDYRCPEDLESGGVLVVGASASGVQLAAEIARSGRPVTLAVGEHVRMPRVYRGRDIQYWMHASGLLDERYDEVDDLRRVRRLPSPQLVGTTDRSTLDLNALSALGVRLTGSLAAVRGGKAQFSGSLRNVCKLADLKMHRLLDTIDAWIASSDTAEALGPSERFEPTAIPASPHLDLDLERGEFRTVLWATGYRPDYAWLHLPVLDHKGYIRHTGGVAASPGLYVMGLPFLRRRKSSFIHGAEDDAAELSEHLANYLHETSGRIKRAV
ncbi:MAG: NAD(P)-binding domain-containing protein [Pseudomonadota bacterium]